MAHQCQFIDKGVLDVWQRQHIVVTAHYGVECIAFLFSAAQEKDMAVFPMRDFANDELHLFQWVGLPLMQGEGGYGNPFFPGTLGRHDGTVERLAIVFNRHKLIASLQPKFFEHCPVSLMR